MIAFILLAIGIFYLVGFFGNLAVLLTFVLVLPYLFILARRIDRRNAARRHEITSRPGAGLRNNFHDLPLLNATGFDEHGIPILGDDDDGLGDDPDDHSLCDCGNHGPVVA